MGSSLFFYQLALIALLWLCLLLHYAWPSDQSAIRPTPPALTPPRRASPGVRRPLGCHDGPLA
jgi:hypothetical protein